MPARTPRTFEHRAIRPNTRFSTPFATRTHTLCAAFSVSRPVAGFFVGVNQGGEGLA